MHKRIIIQTRPSTNVEFWTKDNPLVTNEYLSYMRDTYVITGKLLDVVTDISEDNLTMTTAVIWQSESDADDWKNDLVVQESFINIMESYHNANGIIATRSREDI